MLTKSLGMNKEQKMEIKLQKLKCTKCGWEWIPRKPKVYVCPKCHCYTWAKERPLGKHGKKK